MKILKSQLYELELREQKEKQAEIEGAKMKSEWGSQIRNYVLAPYQLVKDLRTGVETGNTQAVLDGDLDRMDGGLLLAGLGTLYVVAATARLTVVQRKAAKAPDLDPLTGSQGFTHLLQQAFYRKLYILVVQMTVFSREQFNQL